MTDSSPSIAFSQMSVGSVADWRRTGLTDGQLRTLVAAGQLVQLRRHFTWKELFADPARVARRIREAFARQLRLSRIR